jgi:uncharacterized protein YciI
MKKAFTIIILSFGLLNCLPPKKEKINQNQTDSLKIEIDSSLAIQLGADDYGMKNYVMALLKRGHKRWKMDSTTISTLQKGHKENIQKLTKKGKIVVTGTFMDDTELKEICIFDVKTIEEAQKLCETDPAIMAGSLMIELHPWYGSAALRQTHEIHQKITRKKE